MTIWHLIKDDEIIDSVVAESKDFIENQFPDYEVIEDDGIIGKGWKKTEGKWSLEYPTDGKSYIWNEELHCWQIVYSPDEDSVIL